MKTTKPGVLNEAQQRAMSHGSDGTNAGRLLVIAGAGSGKTNTLAHRVAHLVARGANPQRVLLLTFSRRAAKELERRAGELLSAARQQRAGDRAPSLPWSGTFHGIGARILREYAERIGLAPNFTIHAGRFRRPDGPGSPHAAHRRGNQNALPRGCHVSGDLFAHGRLGVAAGRRAER